MNRRGFLRGLALGGLAVAFGWRSEPSDNATITVKANGTPSRPVVFDRPIEEMATRKITVYDHESFMCALYQAKPGDLIYQKHKHSTVRMVYV